MSNDQAEYFECEYCGADITEVAVKDENIAAGATCILKKHGFNQFTKYDAICDKCGLVNEFTITW